MAEPAGDWPVRLGGVTETVVSTAGPEGRWNLAALGLHASTDRGDPVRARTWGRTRTRRNFEERGTGVVQFTDDPLDFAEAALSVREADEPKLDSAAAWARVDVERLATGQEAGTDWVDWGLVPTETGVEVERVPTINRGRNAIVEMTVAASRIGVAGYDDAVLRERLAHLESVVERCGGQREAAALAVVRASAEW